MIMRNQVYQNRAFITRFLNNFSKNFIALFESGNKREFQRLKDFIAS